MATTEYMLDTEEIVKVSWSLFQHDGAAAYKLSERSPLPPAMSAKDLPGGRTQILHVHQIWRVNRQPGNCDEHSAPGSISDTEDWQNWNQDLDNPKDSKDNCVADIESDIQQDNSIEDPQCPEQQYVSTLPNFPRLIRPTGKFKIQTVMVLVTVNAMETRTNKGVKKQ
jgi:hypothetical protein